MLLTPFYIEHTEASWLDLIIQDLSLPDVSGSYHVNLFRTTTNGIILDYQSFQIRGPNT